MTDLPSSTADLRDAVIRFDDALTNLEARLQAAINAISSIEIDSAHTDNQNQNIGDEENVLILREELAYAKTREKELENAIGAARLALNDAIDDIRQVVGSV